MVSDVSEVIDLEVHVDFYDRAGALVGSAGQVFDTESTEEFQTTAGVLGVPLSLSTPAEGARSAVLTTALVTSRQRAHSSGNTRSERSPCSMTLAAGPTMCASGRPTRSSSLPS